MDLVFFGIQGSGKGTQAKLLAKEFGYSIFEAGGELRKIRASGTDLGEEVKSFIDKGKLVPFEIIMRVTGRYVSMNPDAKILFDGVPRDLDQMREFDSIVENAGRDFMCVEIKLSREEARKRIMGRAEKEGRADDADISAIMKRIETFELKTVPVIEEYGKKMKVLEVDGNGTVEEVYSRLKTSLLAV